MCRHLPDQALRWTSCWTPPTTIRCSARDRGRRLGRPTGNSQEAIIPPPRSSAKGGDAPLMLGSRAGDAELPSLAVVGRRLLRGGYDVGLLATAVITARLRRISAASAADALPAPDHPCDRDSPGYPADCPGGQELRRQHVDRRHGPGGAAGAGGAGRAAGAAGAGRAAGAAGAGGAAGAHQDPAVHALIGPVQAVWAVSSVAGP
jgi:hypothetical protein